MDSSRKRPANENTVGEEIKRNKKGKKERRRLRLELQEKETTSISTIEPAPTAKPSFPYEVDEADHAETPFEAYEDIGPVLKLIAQALKKTPNTLKIYDPYYCGGMDVGIVNSHELLAIEDIDEDMRVLFLTRFLRPQTTCLRGRRGRRLASTPRRRSSRTRGSPGAERR